MKDNVTVSFKMEPSYAPVFFLLQELIQVAQGDLFFSGRPVMSFYDQFEYLIDLMKTGAFEEILLNASPSSRVFIRESLKELASRAEAFRPPIHNAEVGDGSDDGKQ